MAGVAFLLILFLVGCCAAPPPPAKKAAAVTGYSSRLPELDWRLLINHMQQPAQTCPRVLESVQVLRPPFPLIAGSRMGLTRNLTDIAAVTTTTRWSLSMELYIVDICGAKARTHQTCSLLHR